MKINNVISDVDDYSSDTNDEYSSDSNNDLSSILSESSEDDQSSDENHLLRVNPRVRSESEGIRTILALLLDRNLLLPGPRLSLRRTYVANIHRYIESRNIKLDLLEKYFLYTSCPAVDILILVASIGNVTYLLEEMMKRLPTEHEVELTVSNLYEEITSCDGLDYLTRLLSTDSQEDSTIYERMSDKVLREHKKIEKELRMYDREERRRLRRRQ